jgi:DNA-binding transcriptional regulator YiaG
MTVVNKGHTNDMTRQKASRLQGVAGSTHVDLPPRDRPINSKTVVCPECKADVGAKCVSAKGEELNNSHKSRRRMAIRAENAGYSIADVEYVLHFTAIGRRRIRNALKISLTQLAEIIGSTYATTSLWEQGKRRATGPAGAAYGIWLRENAEQARHVEEEAAEDDD